MGLRRIDGVWVVTNDDDLITIRIEPDGPENPEDDGDGA